MRRPGYASGTCVPVAALRRSSRDVSFVLDEPPDGPRPGDKIAPDASQRAAAHESASRSYGCPIRVSA